MRLLFCALILLASSGALADEPTSPGDGWTKEEIHQPTPEDGQPQAPPIVIWHPPARGSTAAGLGGSASFEPDPDVPATKPRPTKKANRPAPRKGDLLGRERREPTIRTTAPAPEILATELADDYETVVRWHRAKGALDRVGYLAWPGRVSVAVHRFENKDAAYVQANALVEADPKHERAAAVCGSWAYVGPRAQIAQINTLLRASKLKVVQPHGGIADEWYTGPDPLGPLSAPAQKPTRRD